MGKLGNQPLGKSGRRWENNIILDVIEIACEEKVI
jgi:hypothetical protein